MCRYNQSDMSGRTFLLLRSEMTAAVMTRTIHQLLYASSSLVNISHKTRKNAPNAHSKLAQHLRFFASFKSALGCRLLYDNEKAGWASRWQIIHTAACSVGLSVITRVCSSGLQLTHPPPPPPNIIFNASRQL